MNLKKQLFMAFCSVAILPLAVVAFYLFVSNLMLTFDLYEQNLQNSTEIQAGLVEENINQLMARSTRFAALNTVQEACKNGKEFLLESQELSKDILNFTDETLHNVALFALTDTNGKILYFFGSNSDKSTLETEVDFSEIGQDQAVWEIPFGGTSNSLLINTPIKTGEATVGHLFVVCRTDYFLRLISSHKQVESTSAFIYCTEHEKVVASKLQLENTDLKLKQKGKSAKQDSLMFIVNDQRVFAYYRTIAKTPWFLVSTISTGRIFSQIWSYGIINAIVLFLALLVIFLLSRRQSKRILNPLEQLLNTVEQFFISERAQFPHTDIDPHTEIGYLAGKFVGMSKDMAIAQAKLRESNYLYAALLRATYEFRVVIDLQTNTFECSDGELSEQLNQMQGDSVSERALNLWRKYSVDDKTIDNVLSDIVYGRLGEPSEAEICYRIYKEQEDLWYRIISVPIVDDNNLVCKIVIHFEDITRRKHREFGLIHTSQVDPLCGLFNKTAFPIYCNRSGPGKTDAVFFIDLDKFKHVNDMLGHSVGDEVLIDTAVAIRKQFRDSDTVGRFGGDEFVVFAPNMTQAQAEQRADALVHALSFKKATLQGAEIHVTASVGVCLAKSPMTLEQAVEIADQAMYSAKEKGKAQYYIAQADDLKKGDN